MFPTSTDQPAAPGLQAAVDSLDVAVEHLIKLVHDGALADLGAFGLVDMLQSVERVRNKLPVVDRALIQYGVEQGVPAVLSERTMTYGHICRLRSATGRSLPSRSP